MVGRILDGRIAADSILESIKSSVQQCINKNHIHPKLVVILVGDNPASQHYIKQKEKACQRTGILSERINLDENSTLEQIKDAILRCAHDHTVHGILLQLPLPNRDMEAELLEHIPPEKDVDGFHPFNIGRLAIKQPLLRPCTPYGIIRLLTYYNITLRGKHVVIIGASNIVGRPMLLECLYAHATTTICHSETHDLAQHVLQADICIVAIGQSNVVRAEWIKPGAVVIDVGFERDADGYIHGDIPFKAARERASWITPVPGGVGPMTVATLMGNTLYAAQHLSSKD